MNVTEATAVSTLLRWLLGVGDVDEQEAHAAAAELADWADLVLHTGPTSDDVDQRWPYLGWYDDVGDCETPGPPPRPVLTVVTTGDRL